MKATAVTDCNETGRAISGFVNAPALGALDFFVP